MVLTKLRVCGNNRGKWPRVIGTLNIFIGFRGDIAEDVLTDHIQALISMGASQTDNGDERETERESV